MGEEGVIGVGVCGKRLKCVLSECVNWPERNELQCTVFDYIVQ